MAREINRLTDRGVAALKEPGLHADGAGLYLRIDQTLNRRWVLVYFWQKKRREMGLGSATTVKLKTARLLAEQAREAIRRGEDPIAVRKAADAPPVTTHDVLKELLVDLKKGWKSGKHQAQWETMLERHCARILAMPVADVTTEDVLRALRPIWTTKSVSARKIRGRLERVFSAARVKGLRSGENPAAWRGHLDQLLSRERAAPRHHPAMPYEDLPAFMAELAERDSSSARALRWTILTAARTGETRGAPPAEIQGDIWVIPKQRMKMSRDHRVPLTEAALSCLADGWETGPYIFEGSSKDGGLSDMAMAQLLKGMRPGVTVHGFRSTFKDWAEDCTEFSNATIEAALAHQVGDATEQAYRRRDAIEKRRRLMEAWATYCTTAPRANVIPMRKA